MFRIKTDIRHYRCEDRGKVERLIRNWVIRPSDLLYDDEVGDWRPIGEHPSFVDIFRTLEEAHENQPETVVTPRAANKAKRDRQRRTDDDADDAEPSPPEPSSDVVGMIKDSDEITELTPSTYAMMDRGGAKKNGELPQPDGEIFERAGPREPTDLIDMGEGAERMSEPATKGASPPESDESAAISSEESSADDSGADDQNEEVGRHDLPEELFATAEIEGERQADDDETTNVFEEPSQNREPKVEVADEALVVEVDGDEPEDHGAMFDDVDDDAVARDDESKRRRTGSQWNIVLDEVPSDEQEAEEEPTVETTVGEEGIEEEPTVETTVGEEGIEEEPTVETTVDEEGDPSGDEPAKSPEEREGLRAVGSDVESPEAHDDPHEKFDDVDPFADTGDHDLEDVADEALRDTDELDDDADELDDDADELDDDADELDDDADELDDDADELDDDADEQECPPETPKAEEQGLDFGSEPAFEGDQGPSIHVIESVDQNGEDGEERDKPKIEVDEIALEEAFDDLEEAAVDARREGGFSKDDPPLIEATALEELGASLEGYERDLSIRIEPSPYARRRGIEHNEASSWEKDRRYPQPEPGENGEVFSNTFRFDRESFQALTPDVIRGVVVVVGAAVVAFLVLGLWVC